MEVGQAVVVAHPDLIAAGTIVRHLDGGAVEVAERKSGRVIEVETSHLVATMDLSDAAQIALILEEHQIRFGG